VTPLGLAIADLKSLKVANAKACPSDNSCFALPLWKTSFPRCFAKQNSPDGELLHLP
jgi:hypothetical protein